MDKQASSFIFGFWQEEGMDIDDVRPDGAAKYLYYLYSVTNPKEVIEEGAKPDLEEVGPFGFRKYTEKYDIAFDDDGGVTYKTWSYWVSADDEDMPSDADHDDFCLDLTTKLEGAAAPTSCLPLDTSVTIFNLQFWGTVAKYTEPVVVGMLGQQVWGQVSTFIHSHFMHANIHNNC